MKHPNGLRMTNPMNGYRLFKVKDLERLLHQVEKSGEDRSKQRLMRRAK